MSSEETRRNSLLRKFGSGWIAANFRDEFDPAKPAYGRVFTHMDWDTHVWVCGGPSSARPVTGVTMPAEAREALEKMGDGSLSPGIFHRQTLQAMAAVAGPRGRYALDCLLIEWPKAEDQSPRLTATDGRHLASICNDAKPIRKHTRLHVNAQALAFVYEALDVYAGRYATLAVTHVEVAGRQALAIRAGANAAALLYQPETAYPDYSPVIPQTRHAVTLPAEFFHAVDLAGRTSGVAERFVRVSIAPAMMAQRLESVIGVESRHTLTAGVVLRTSATLTPQKAATPPHPLEIGFDPVYISHADAVITARDTRQRAELELRYTDQDTGAMIAPQFAKDSRHVTDDFYLVMPIQL